MTRVTEGISPLTSVYSQEYLRHPLGLKLDLLTWDRMGCSTSSQTSAVDTTRPSVKPEESNGATGAAGENGRVAEDSETIPDQTPAEVDGAKPADAEVPAAETAPSTDQATPAEAVPPADTAPPADAVPPADTAPPTEAVPPADTAPPAGTTPTQAPPPEDSVAAATEPTSSEAAAAPTE